MFSFPSVISYTVSMRDNLLLLNLLFLAWIFRMPQLIKSWGIFNVYLPIFFAILNRWLNDKYLLSVYNDSCQRGTAMQYRVLEYLLRTVCWQMTISYLNIWIMSAINSMNKVRQCFEVCGNFQEPKWWGCPVDLSRDTCSGRPSGFSDESRGDGNRQGKRISQRCSHLIARNFRVQQ